MSTHRTSWAANSWKIAKEIPKHALHRYRNLQPLGKAFIWATLALYITIVVVFIVITPARIFQWLYDLAQKLSHLEFGWLVLGAIIGTLPESNCSALR